MYEIDLCLKYRMNTHCLNEELGIGIEGEKAR